MSKIPDWLKVGALCATRDGRKVRILATDFRDRDQPVVAIIEHNDREDGVATFHANGSFIRPSLPCDTDLAGPWEPKLPELRVGMIVQLRDGSTARILCVDALGRGPESVVVLHTSLSTPQREGIEFYRPSGRWAGDNTESRMDMVKVIGSWRPAP
jgi:hypothetical protein